MHLHVDAAPPRQVHTFANLVRLFSDWRDVVRAGALVERLLDRCQDPRPIRPPRPGERLADLLP